MRDLHQRAGRCPLLALLAAVAAAGCAERQPVIEDSMSSRLDASTSIGDVKQILGSPTRTYAFKDGQKTLVYLRRCRDEPLDEKCAAAPEGARWQRCLINFDQADRWNGTSCTWTTTP